MTRSPSTWVVGLDLFLLESLRKGRIHLNEAAATLLDDAIFDRPRPEPVTVVERSVGDLGALVWVRSRGRRCGQTLIPLPGTRRVAHLVANIAAAELAMSDTDLDRFDAVVAEAKAA